MSDQVIYDGVTDNIAASASARATITGSRVIKCWSATADFDSGTVTVYLVANDDSLIALTTFTTDGFYLLAVGDSSERITAKITGVVGASADISLTVGGER